MFIYSVCVLCVSNHEIGSDSAMSCESSVEKLLACIHSTTDDNCDGGVLLKRQFIQRE